MSSTKLKTKSIKLKDPLKLNDWDIKGFIIITTSIQLAFFGSVGLDKINFQIPFLRQILGFVYLAFLPGYSLLRILRIHNLSSSESILYALGLSLFIDMLVGFLMNLIYPILGITSRPISEVPIMLTMAGVMCILNILAYIRDNDYSNIKYINVMDIINPWFLFLSLIPIMTIFGTYLVNYYNMNILLMSTIIIISLVALLIGLTDIISKKSYVYAIWNIAISLIFSITLISEYIKIYDGEGYIPRTIMRQGALIFSPNYPQFISNYFSVIGNTILVPIISYMCKLDLIWIYKVIFPFFVSMIPVGMFILIESSKILSNNRETFFSVFLYIILPSFFNLLPFLKKQTLAMFFLVLFFVTIYNKNIQESSRTKLIIIMLLSILWAHYGTATLIVGMLVFSSIIQSSIIKLFRHNTSIRSIKLMQRITILYLTLFIGWYMNVSSSSVITTIINIMYRIYITILTSFFIPEASRGFVRLTDIQNNVWYILSRSIFLMISFLVFIGYLQYLTKIFRKKAPSNADILYLSYSLYWMVVLVAAIIVPFFAVMSPSRLYIIAYLTLAPFSIIGFKTLKTNLILRVRCRDNESKAIYLMFILYLLLTTGFINEILKVNPNSLSLSQESILKFGSIEEKGRYYSMIIHPQDVQAVRWLYLKRDPNKHIYATLGYLDTAGVFMEYGGIPLNKLLTIKENTDLSKIQRNSYIFLYVMNIYGKIGVDVNQYNSALIWYDFTHTKFYQQLKLKNKIYNNMGSQIILT
ncbi:conserved membrane protein of unknown function [Thermococcus nautili]|uniref:DUF2206 domain-containing protein n=1 Tax=Thermococcus nautili TaxID=195522 RepID=UPI002553484C|nr:DUF2206 domain-containing protein [Thermococcus nautili]CAI1492440.1 conserved membrane protein of unknown function [Thermococcus nautili]